MATIRKTTLKNGKTSYQAVIRLSGYPHKRASFTRLGEARDWVSKTESDMKLGRHFKDALARKYTVGDLIDRYMKEVLEVKSDRPRYIATQRGQLLWWRERIGSYNLINVTPFLLSECRDELRVSKQLKPGTINRYLGALSHTFTIACKEWNWVESNPINNVTKAKEPRGRVRFLSDKEREALLNACQVEKRKPLYLIAILAISTGARKMEILGLKWKDVDLKRGYITVNETKNGEIRSLFLSGLALELMKTYAKCRTQSGLVFSSHQKKPITIESEWKRAITKAGIIDFRFHDLRHTAASYLAMNGASIAEIAEVLGHKTLNMVKRYAHLSQTHTAAVVASMNEKVFGDILGSSSVEAYKGDEGAGFRSSQSF